MAGRKQITLWMYYRWGKYSITPDPDELPGGREWFTAWHETREGAIEDARRWLGERGLEPGEVVIG